MAQSKVFRGHVNGYVFVTASLSEMQGWIDARKRDCKGQMLRLHQGVGTVRCATYSAGAPMREAVL